MSITWRAIPRQNPHALQSCCATVICRGRSTLVRVLCVLLGSPGSSYLAVSDTGCFARVQPQQAGGQGFLSRDGTVGTDLLATKAVEAGAGLPGRMTAAPAYQRRRLGRTDAQALATAGAGTEVYPGVRQDPGPDAEGEVTGARQVRGAISGYLKSP